MQEEILDYNSETNLLESRVSEVIKKTHLMKNLEEYAQNKCGEKWKYADLKALDSFPKSSLSQIKHAAGLNMRNERIKAITKE